MTRPVSWHLRRVRPGQEVPHRLRGPELRGRPATGAARRHVRRGRPVAAGQQGGQAHPEQASPWPIGRATVEHGPGIHAGAGSGHGAGRVHRGSDASHRRGPGAAFSCGCIRPARTTQAQPVATPAGQAGFLACPAGFPVIRESTLCVKIDAMRVLWCQ